MPTPNEIAVSNPQTQTVQTPQMNLSMLTDFLLQKTYHEIMVLSELLPRKSDIERKIEIIQFSSRARQQFIRLLALVKWASNSKRLQKCQAISTFLDQQNMHFIDTADMLARISRENLVQARLPNFSLPTAIDVLTTGSFKRLPRCIKDRVVPPEPITQIQTEDIYLKLNNIIKHRLATSKLPPRFTRVSIGSGRLTLTVKDEFEVSLTVMGLDPSLPWRILKIKFLVQGADVAEGKSLVHGLQTQYIHSIVQSRIMSFEEPMLEIYNCLHYFSLSLQLEVFHMQARKLILERWGNSVKIDAYIVGQKLTISYWRKPVVKANSEDICSITVHADVSTSEPTVHHEPPIYGSTDLLSKKSNLSIEEVLNTAIRKRTLYQLNELCSHLRRDPFFISHCIFDEESVCLRLLPSLTCSNRDICRVSVDIKSGHFKISVPDVAIAYKKDLESYLTTDRDTFMKTFNDVRSCLYISAIQTHLSVPGIVILKNLSFFTDEKNALASLSLHRIFLIPPHSKHCLALSISIDTKIDSKPLTPKAFVIACTHPSANLKSKEQSETTRIIQSVFEVDLNCLAATAINSQGSIHRLGSKRKLSILPKVNPHFKLSRQSYDDTVMSSWHRFHDEASVAALLLHFCHRIPFVDIFDQLTISKIRNQGVVFDNCQGHMIGLLEIPSSSSISNNIHDRLQRICFEQCIRMNESFELIYQIDFSETPFDGIALEYQLDTKLCVSKVINEGHQNNTIINVVMETWKIISKIYELGQDLAMYLNDNEAQESLVSCHVLSFDFVQIVIAYGPKKNYKVTVTCHPTSDDYNFNLSFGMTSNDQTTNPHHITRSKLIEEFNKHRNIAYLIKVLNCTLVPLSALNTLPALASMGTTTRLFMPLKDYTILPLNSSRLNLAYRDCFVIEIYILENGVLFKDGSCSSVDYSKSVNNVYPLYQLQDFLSQYCDNSTTRFNIENEHPNTPAGNSEMVPMSPAEGIFNSSNEAVGSNVSSRDRPMRSPAIASPSNVAPSPGQIQSVPSPGTFLQPSPMVSQYNSVSPGGWPPSPLPGGAVSKSSSQAQRYPPAAPGRCIYPIMLSTASFCDVVTVNEKKPNSNQAPLDRYFGALFFRRHLVRVARTDETLRLEKTDPLSFSGNPLSGIVSTFRLNPTTKDSLCLKITIKQGIEYQWNTDELRILENYFDTKVASAPYKAHALTAFARLLGAPPKILSDCIKVMLLELRPDANARWRVEWCLTVPLTMSNFAGTPSVVLKAKSLFFFNFIETHGKRRTAPLSVVFVPDLNQCQTFQSMRPQGAPAEEPSFELSMHQAATELLKNYSDTLNGRECSIFNSVVHLMKTLDSSKY